MQKKAQENKHRGSDGGKQGCDRRLLHQPLDVKMLQNWILQQLDLSDFNKGRLVKHLSLLLLYLSMSSINQ